MNALYNVLGKGFTDNRIESSTILTLISKWINKRTRDALPYSYTLTTFYNEVETGEPKFSGDNVTEYYKYTLGDLPYTVAQMIDRHSTDINNESHELTINFNAGKNTVTIKVFIDRDGRIESGKVFTLKGDTLFTITPATLNNRVKEADTYLEGMYTAYTYYLGQGTAKYFEEIA